MTIIGCFLLPGSCSIAPGVHIPQATAAALTREDTWCAEFYDESSGRLILKTCGRLDTEKAIDEMVQKNPHLKVVLYFESTF